MPPVQVQLGSLTLEPHRQLLAGGTPVPLGRKALSILTVLVDARGGLVTKDELLDAVWSGVVVEENALQVHIAALRKALGAEAGRLTTVRGVGYRLDVSQAKVVSGEGADPGHGGAGRSVAVLPFANLTGDQGRDYLADGIAEEVICTLSRSSDLKVSARTSSFAYRGRDRDVREIARALSVAAVLEGSVRIDGDRIRVTAQLVDGATGYHLWSENYDRDLVGLIALQDEIAKAIGETMQARFTGSKERTGDPEAFQLYYRARSLNDRASPENILRAIDLFKQAIARDPDYVAAQLGLANAIFLARFLSALPPEAALEAVPLIERAVRLDPDNAQAQALMTHARLVSLDWLGAEECVETALSLDPDEPMIYIRYIVGLLLPVGHLDRAEWHARRVRELAPASALANFQLACVAAVRGQYETALQALTESIEMGVPEQGLVQGIRAWAAAAGGDFEQAAAHFARAIKPPAHELAAERVSALVYRVLAGTGSRVEAAAAVRDLLAQARAAGTTGRAPMFAGYLLDWAFLLDDRDLARAIADQVAADWAETHLLDHYALWPLWMPGREWVRDDPSFRAFFDKVRLTAYWHERGPPDPWSAATSKRESAAVAPSAVE